MKLAPSVFALGEDTLPLVRIAAKHCLLPHPNVVKSFGCAVFPAIRDQRNRLTISEVGGAAYLRMGAARPYLESRRLHLVDATPSFSYSVYAVYSAKADESLMNRWREGSDCRSSSFAKFNPLKLLP
jgi:hypothetical protein